MHRRAAIILILGGALLAACNVEPAATTTTAAATTTTAPATTAAPAATTTTTTTAESICLSGDLPFVERGSVARLGAGVGDAGQLAAIRWGAHPGCERVVIDLLTAEAAPASSIGEAAAALIEENGVIRISLPRAVTKTGIFDTRFDGELARRAFVVRLPDGSLAVDVHTGSSVPVQARAFTVDAPARIVVDLSPTPAGGTAVTAPPTIAGNVVVLSPSPGEADYPLTISGYARTFEASVVARLIIDGSVVSETVTTAADWTDAWGSFSLAFVEGPSGPVSLFVGEDSARDGTPVGVTISLMLP